MKNVLKSRTALTFTLLLISNFQAAVMAEDASSGGASDARRRQVAYLTPTVDLQHARDVAQAAYQSTNFNGALSHYQNLSQSTAANAKDFYWLGETYAHLNRYPEAAQAFDRALAMDPRLDTAQIPLVQAYLGANQQQIAAQKCASAIRTVTDPVVRQQLTLLEPYCHPRPPVHLNSAEVRSRRMLEHR